MKLRLAKPVSRALAGVWLSLAKYVALIRVKCNSNIFGQSRNLCPFKWFFPFVYPSVMPVAADLLSDIWRLSYVCKPLITFEKASIVRTNMKLSNT